MFAIIFPSTSAFGSSDILATRISTLIKCVLILFSNKVYTTYNAARNARLTSRKSYAYHPIVHPMRGASRGDPEAGWIAAPAGGVRNLALGRPWVAVRAHYGALPLMAGRGADEGWRKPAGSGAQEGPVRARKLRPRGQKSRLWSAERRPRTERWYEKLRTRLAALHTPHCPRGQFGKTAYPAPIKNTGERVCPLFEN